MFAECHLVAELLGSRRLGLVAQNRISQPASLNLGDEFVSLEYLLDQAVALGCWCGHF